jgi:hypothetical protein
MSHCLLCALLAGATATYPGTAAAQTPSPPEPACSAPEYRQFDFWLGEWEVTTPDSKVAGRNQITRIAGGCALHENWAGRGGFTGQSLNGWNKLTRQWQQTWLDSSGGRLDLTGSLQGASMVLEGREAPEGNKPALQHRVTWTPQPDGSVRQHWESSDDGGRTWHTTFDGRYRKAP